ncbi:MAG: hypothetical protein COZ05_17950 [Armatimonadetes bacterium CG_4_10_14_3_um_filter_59_10]|nr:MAG: hypothetical protein COZ05_17950 [Armatimonadetes bacterium CG_4_10_14_3_um_filter_59_10]
MGCQLCLSSWAISLILLISGALHADGNAPSPLRSRIAKAKSLQSAAMRTLSSLERDLVFFANFEHEGLALLGNSEAIPVKLEADHYRPGRFGRGYYFEKARHNLLPPAAADVESGVEGFKATGGAQLRLVSAETAFGKRALSVSLPSTEARVETVPIKVNFSRHLGHEKLVTLLTSCYVKGPKEGRVKLEVKLLPVELPTENPVADEPSTQEITLTGGWQRVACSVKADARLKEREAVFSVQSASAGTLATLTDGFQFEQAAYYPHHHLMPTTWTPGGESVPATYIDVNDAALREAFPVNEGTVSFWTSSPRHSNLTNQGGIYWLSFGVWWRDPQWAMGTYIFQTGEKFCYSRLPADITDGNWHHLAMSWDASKGYEYKDGKLLQTFDRTETDVSKRLELYRLRLGGSVNDGQAANSVMDEVAVFKRRLSDDEIGQLATATEPLRPTPNKLLLTRAPRRVFYRDEVKASVDTGVFALDRVPPSFSIDLSVGDAAFATKLVKLQGGATTATLDFAPQQLQCGSYLLRVAAIAADGSSAYLEYTIDVVPALRPDNYTISSWGSGGETAEWREFCKGVGINTIDTYSANFDDLGRSGLLYSWHYNFGRGGVWNPQTRQAVREETREHAKRRASFPNWRFTLLNSETPPWIMPDEKDRATWFDAWAQKELGFPVPEKSWKFGTTHNPIQCWFPEGSNPGKDGVYEPTQEEFRFLKWWYNRGCGWWRINAEAAAEIKKLRPDVLNYTEPLWYPGQVADLNAGSNWSYNTRPEPILGELESSYACLRGSDKEFYATLGMDYVSGDWLTVTDAEGKKKHLKPTPDDIIQQTWVAVAGLPTHGLAYWFLEGWFHGLRGEQDYYCPPESDAKLGQEMRRNLYPIGTMLKGAPNAQRPLALLLPESTLWYDAGEGGWGWGTTHYSNYWRGWVGKSGVPYDVVLDNNVAPGSLSRYKAVVFPMAEYVSAEIHRELVSAAKAGTRIIVDAYCRQDYPGMERWDQEYFYKMSAAKRTDYGKLTEQRLAELRAALLPELDAYAVGEEGPVLINVREADGVRYVAVINNHRQAGPYTEWTRARQSEKKEVFQPYGKAQSAKVYLKAPAETVIYEFTQSARATAMKEDGRTVVKLDLPASGGRLLCLYPTAIASVKATVSPSVRLGSSADVAVSVLDVNGAPVGGRQLVEAKILGPAGSVHDESGLYRAMNGRAMIPFRPAINDVPGVWKIELRERTSGLQSVVAVTVTSAPRGA